MTEIRDPKYILEIGWQAILKDLGISVQDVLRHAQLPLDLLTRKSPTVTAEEYFRLWHGLAYVLRDEPTFPLRLVRAITPEVFSPPIFASLCSRDLNMALKRIAHYKPLVGPIRLDMAQHSDHTAVSFSAVSEGAPLPPSIIAFELAFWVQISRIATRERIIPQAIYTTHPLPGAETYAAFFGRPVERHTTNTILFAAADARKPFLTVNDAMWAIFEPALRRRMDDLTQNAPFRERVRACLIEIMASGRYSIEDVASQLAVSSRTLQRRLQQEQTSFQHVLDELREELARHYLATTDYSNGQIAFLLGYEEPNSFFRAFRTWTGQTPETIRTTAR